MEKLKDNNIHFLVMTRSPNRKSISFLKSLDVNYIKDMAFLSHQIDFEGPSTKSIVFLNALCGEDEKQLNTSFGYKKGSKSNQCRFCNLCT